MKEKNVYLDEETREDNAEPRVGNGKKATAAPASAPLPLNTREECLYV